MFEFIKTLYHMWKTDGKGQRNLRKFDVDLDLGGPVEEERGLRWLEEEEEKDKVDVIQRGCITIYKLAMTEEEFEDMKPEDVYTSGYNPYCIRCGTKLSQIEKNDKYWGDYWKTMAKYGTEYYLCPNEKCCHHHAPLVLHHPIQGYNAPAGDSYSLSWVKWKL